MNIEIWNSAQCTPEEIRARESAQGDSAEAVVAEIIQDVRTRGDEALRAYTKRFDGVELAEFLVDKQEIQASLAQVDAALLDTMRRAADNIRAYHQRQVSHGYVIAEQEGILLGQRVSPLDRVGLYIPGGTAAYPSTVLMNAIPAAIAGVREILLATPPDKNGCIAPAILAAAHIAGVDKIYKMGGAQAIAAMAFGTQSVQRVDKITGPGNIFVATAKRQVYGIVDIDMIAGPSEILVIADESANAAYVAADLLSQAEHDKMAASILLTTSEALAISVREELARQLPLLPRKEIAEASLSQNGRIVLTSSLREAACISNAIAPEHLELCVRDPMALMGAIRHAGSIFLGHHTPEALGDYFAGANHTLPTNGAARFASPLCVDDFVKKSSFLQYSEEALRSVQGDVERFARSEGFEAHATSVRIRFS